MLQFHPTDQGAGVMVRSELTQESQIPYVNLYKGIAWLTIVSQEVMVGED